MDERHLRAILETARETVQDARICAWTLDAVRGKAIVTLTEPCPELEARLLSVDPSIEIAYGWVDYAPRSGTVEKR